MGNLRLFHFSSSGGIGRFEPRPPLARPEVEPLVWAIDEHHSPLYLFPRDCPRIGVWPIESTSPEDRAAYHRENAGAMRLAIDGRHESLWRSSPIWRYEFDPSDGFEDLHDHGCWVSRRPVDPIGLELIASLPAALESLGLSVVILPDLRQEALRWRDGQRGWLTTLHVSMIRMRLLEQA